METEKMPSTTQKPFEIHPGDEMSPEANRRAIMALKNAKEYSIEGDTIEKSVFEKLVIKGTNIEHLILKISDILLKSSE